MFRITKHVAIMHQKYNMLHKYTEIFTLAITLTCWASKLPSLAQKVIKIFAAFTPLLYGRQQIPHQTPLPMKISFAPVHNICSICMLKYAVGMPILRVLNANFINNYAYFAVGSIMFCSCQLNRVPTY